MKLESHISNVLLACESFKGSVITSISFLAFFVATQFFFTICFVWMLIAIGMVLMYLLCIDDYYRVKVLKWIGVDLLLAGTVGD